jgi:hypothetical protein
MRTSSRSRRFVPSLDALQSRLLLSDTTVITPMDPVPAGYTDTTTSTPDSTTVITPMDPVPVGYTDGTGGDTTDTVAPITVTTAGYVSCDTTTDPTWSTSAASMGDMVATTPSTDTTTTTVAS